ncbi:Na+/H+ antiporter subunit E [Pararhodospirillum photometricum]|uniref:Cation antiporter n=1 Tax=Pararhodospirillum photometricum DSM 122 TaxID=1150469 RepID=H6SPG8_PARPM|nr:Na+/H+ antiporter subunit E [Pararhodospirillum photometricum]CCG09493.1 Cation antiporter [Pararhodospirillum photometricum DSM 122]
MVKASALGLGLYGLWLLMSGYWDDPLLLGFGVLSALVCVALALKMQIVDDEGVPLALLARLGSYLPWLAWQVVLSNLTVARAVLAGRAGISPSLGWVRPSQRTDLGRVIYANSITLTPGTFSLDLGERGILVHALQAGGLEDLEAGAMDRRVTAVEGS